MTRPTITPTRVDPAVDKNFTVLQQILCGSLSYDNMNIRVIQGQTASLPDTAGLLIHSMSPKPIGWFPLVGDVYVQNIDEKYIDVRSTKPSVNYKIIILAGTPVTSETVAAVGGDGYQDTIEVIENPTGETPIGDEPEDTNPRTPTIGYTTGVAETPSGGRFNSIIKIGNYFYVAGEQVTGTIYRINTITGESDSISTGSAESVSAFYYDSVDLWCCDTMLNNSGTLTINVYRINLTSFSITSTLVCNTTGPFTNALANIACIYVDGSRVYLGGVSLQGTHPGKMQVYNKTTGAQISTFSFSSPTWGTLSNGGVMSINVNAQGTEMYLTTMDCTSLSKMRVMVINLAAGTSSTFTISDNLRVTGGAAVYYGGSLWIPVQPISELSNISVISNNRYRMMLMEFNTTTQQFIEHPVPVGVNLTSNTLGSYFIRNCVLVEDFIYMVVAQSGQPTVVIEYDILDDSFTNFLCPMIHDMNTTTSNPTCLNTVLVKDSNSEVGFVIVKQITSTSSGLMPNFEWFEPILEE